jgi:hypothetical protein
LRPVACFSGLVPGGSDDGGLCEFVEFCPSCASNSATRRSFLRLGRSKPIQKARHLRFESLDSLVPLVARHEYLSTRRRSEA